MMSDETENNKFTFYDLRTSIIYLIAVFFLFGTWVEVAMNADSIGAVLGFIPGGTLAFI